MQAHNELHNGVEVLSRIMESRTDTLTRGECEQSAVDLSKMRSYGGVPGVTDDYLARTAEIFREESTGGAATVKRL